MKKIKTIARMTVSGKGGVGELLLQEVTAGAGVRRLTRYRISCRGWRLGDTGLTVVESQLPHGAITETALWQICVQRGVAPGPWIMGLRQMTA